MANRGEIGHFRRFFFLLSSVLFRLFLFFSTVGKPLEMAPTHQCRWRSIRSSSSFIGWLNFSSFSFMGMYRHSMHSFIHSFVSSVRPWAESGARDVPLLFFILFFFVCRWFRWDFSLFVFCFCARACVCFVWRQVLFLRLVFCSLWTFFFKLSSRFGRPSLGFIHYPRLSFGRFAPRSQPMKIEFGRNRITCHCIFPVS